jgi:hypothetical protein
MATTTPKFFPKSLAWIGFTASAFGVVLVGCTGSDLNPYSKEPLPPVVIRLVPGNATVAVGDTAQLVGEITGGSALTPPSVFKCTATLPNVVTTIRSLTACTVVGVAAGTTEVIAMASTGQVDTAAIVVVPR